jgi:hypothetical protein
MKYFAGMDVSLEETARVPAPYGLTEYDVVNRIAILAAQEGWVRPCQRAVPALVPAGGGAKFGSLAS